MLLKDMEDQHFLIGLQLNFALCENAPHKSWGIWGRGKRAGIHGFWFGGFGLFEFLRAQTICSQALFLEHGYRVAYSRWRDTRCKADTSKLVYVRRSRALSFGGVLNLKSAWKLASST